MNWSDTIDVKTPADKRVERLESELRKAKREKRKAMKLLKGQMVTDSRIIGGLKRELAAATTRAEKAEAKLVAYHKALFDIQRFCEESDDQYLNWIQSQCDNAIGKLPKSTKEPGG